MKNLSYYFIALVLILTLGTGCAKKCPVPTCQMVLDHQHFFGAENDASGETISKDSPLPDGGEETGKKKKKGLFSKINPFKKKNKNTASADSSGGVDMEAAREKTDITKVSADTDKNDYKGTEVVREGGIPPAYGEEAAPRTVGSTLPVYRGVPWWRRCFKKKYRTEQDLRYKNMERHRYSGKNKDQLKKPFKR